MSSHGASGPRLPPPAKRIGYTGQPLDARKLRNIDKWPAGVSKKGRLGFYPTQCYLCYKDGHLANTCTVLPHLLLKSRVDTLRAHKISVTTEQARALLHNTLSQDDLEKVLATQALAQSVDDDNEMQEASAASWHIRISGKEGKQCLCTKVSTPFLLDSGATRHMTMRLDLLHNYHPLPADHRVRAELVSLNCLIEDGYNVCGTSASEALGLIVFRNTVDAHFRLRNKQFVLEASPLPPSFPHDSALNVALPPSADLPFWHGRLGHSGVNVVLVSGKVGSIGLNTAAVTPDLMQLVKDCVPCHLGKDAAHCSHAPTTHRATAPIGQVYMDLWGPGPVVSLSGHCYLCGATDQFARYRWLRGISAKSDTTCSIKDLIAFANVQYPGSPFCMLVRDCGGEFMNRELDDWLTSRGVVHKLSAPYEHGQMGLQERSWRSIFDKVCTALAQSGLPLFLWEEAAHTAVYALNLTATSALNDSTPDLVLHASGNPVTKHCCPRGSHLRIWGCCALVPLLPEQCGHKLAPRSRHCFFVGYSQTSKVWRFYDPACRKVFESSQATFYEREFEPVGDWSTCNRGPPAHFGEFAMAATSVTKFGADKAHAVKIIDFQWAFTARPNPDAPTYWEAMSSKEQGMWLLAIERHEIALEPH
ncbi:BQ5605_C011g06552 [Microbotryum silenes-dioicae]|uniref:BQ5605_C011g06552 protein n=1 Tax=Microbotryum silenes-dioicae TaxID=796604 RepID=A0A2X0LTM2_9BASI|nr:BQ5605_C011g06552 [Microbotryum silenes-dioicae]